MELKEDDFCTEIIFIIWFSYFQTKNKLTFAGKQGNLYIAQSSQFQISVTISL